MTQTTDNNRLERIEQKLDDLIIRLEKFNEPSSNYRQITQWLVRLAFILIASMPIMAIITSVFNK